jgi:hypothetical protein
VSLKLKEYSVNKKRQQRWQGRASNSDSKKRREKLKDSASNKKPPSKNASDLRRKLNAQEL